MPEMSSAFQARTSRPCTGGVTDAAAAMIDLGLFPIAIGGGHDLTYAFVRDGEARPGMVGISLDAHSTCASAGSGMVYRRLVEDCAVRGLHVHG